MSGDTTFFKIHLPRGVLIKDNNRPCLSQHVGVRPGEPPGSAVQVSAPRELCVGGDPQHGEPAEQHHHDPEEDPGQ